MKKPYHFSEMSDERCVKCGRPIKRNVVEKSPKGKIFRCYLCGKEAKGK